MSLCLKIAALVSAIFLLPSPAAWCASVSIPASKDNTIYESNATHSAGGAAGIFSGSTGQGSPRRGLIAFDVAGNVPAGSTVTSAELTLYLGAGGGPNVTIGLHKLLADWGEGTAGSTNPGIGGGGQGFPAGVGDATWVARFHSATAPILWSSAGANGDFEMSASATALIGNAHNTPFQWLSTPNMIADVQSWLDVPDTNFGWAMINGSDGSNGSVRAFYSSEATQNAVGGALDPAWRPSLRVTYVPEPASALLAVAALLITMQFRRRMS